MQKLSIIFLLAVFLFFPTPSSAAKSYEINTEDENLLMFPVHDSKRRLISNLKKALRNYKRIANQGWPTIDRGPKMELGYQGPRVLQLRERLWVTTDFNVRSELKSEVFDEGLLAAVKKFQLRHGLNPDGVVGKGTLKMMNMPIEKKIKMMETNIQRLKDWDNTIFGDHYVFINVPDYRLSVVNKGRQELAMRVIVGLNKKDYRTPLFSDEMEYVVLSPKWHVPSSITVKEIAPKIQKDPDYLKKRNYKIVPTKKQKDGEEFDPNAIDWSNVDKDNINFRLIKGSGWGNDLGLFKFIFPNKFSVYLHDTHSPYLFRRDFRALSHGCVRVSDPLTLAEYLLRDREDWERARIKKVSRQGKEKFIHFDEHIPIHLQYFTAWVDAKGRVNFRNDVYRYDRYVVMKQLPHE